MRAEFTRPQWHLASKFRSLLPSRLRRLARGWNWDGSDFDRRFNEMRYVMAGGRSNLRRILIRLGAAPF